MRIDVAQEDNGDETAYRGVPQLTCIVLLELTIATAFLGHATTTPVPRDVVLNPSVPSPTWRASVLRRMLSPPLPA